CADNQTTEDTMAIGTVSDSQRSTSVDSRDSGADTVSTATTDAKRATASKLPAPGEVVDAVRSMAKGIEDAIRSRLQGEPKADEVAGGTKPCGRGGKCMAQGPTRGLAD